MVGFGFALFGDPRAAYSAAAAAVAAALVRELLERFAARRLAIDPRPAYAAVPLDPSARRNIRRLLIWGAVTLVAVAAGAAVEPDFVPAAVVLAITEGLCGWDLSRVLRHDSYVALTRLAPPPAPDRDSSP